MGGPRKAAPLSLYKQNPSGLRVQRSSRPEQLQRRVLRRSDLRVAFPSARASGLSMPSHTMGILKMDMEAPGDTRSFPPFIGARCPQAHLLREGSSWPPPLCLRQVAQCIPPPFSSVSWDFSFSKCFRFCRCFIILARRAPRRCLTSSSSFSLQIGPPWLSGSPLK